MDLADYIGEPCKNKLAYQFIPRKKTRINLNIAAKELSNITTIEMETRILLMVRHNQCTISIFPSGKLLIRGERDEKKAREIAEKLVQQLKESQKN